MKETGKARGTLVLVEDAQRLDALAWDAWGFSPFALVERAGERCAAAAAAAFPGLFAGGKTPWTVALAGSGSNGADALAALRSWIIEGRIRADRAGVILSRTPEVPLGADAGGGTGADDGGGGWTDKAAGTREAVFQEIGLMEDDIEKLDAEIDELAALSEDDDKDLPDEALKACLDSIAEEFDGWARDGDRDGDDDGDGDYTYEDEPESEFDTGSSGAIAAAAAMMGAATSGKDAVKAPQGAAPQGAAPQGATPKGVTAPADAPAEAAPKEPPAEAAPVKAAPGEGAAPAAAPNAPSAGRASPKTPLEAAIVSLQKMGVAVRVWGEGEGGEKALLAQADLIIDGIAGTGAVGALDRAPAKMAAALNALRKGSAVEAGAGAAGEAGAGAVGKTPVVVSIDVPSGLTDEWQPGMPLVKADATAAIEPLKRCLFHPGARARAGRLLPVRGVFPQALIRAALKEAPEAALLDWESARGLIPKIPPDAYKHKRGAALVYGGETGTTGAPVIAARGAQAAGAGLVRLAAESDIYQVLAAGAGGVMVIPPETVCEGGFDAMLLGPGWGDQSEAPEPEPPAGSRDSIIKFAMYMEEKGLPLILDAGAVALAKHRVFHGNALLTPHVGEFARLTGRTTKEALERPWELLIRTAKAKNAVIMLKSCVTLIAAPDGKTAVVDGLLPGLASGGTGDMLAGFCAALAARAFAGGWGKGQQALFNCAAAAAALTMEAGRARAGRFTDPLELVSAAAALAGEAWLP